MKSFIKAVVIAIVLYACVASGEEESKPRYSSFECTEYDKDHPEDLSMRNCILHDVVLASEKGQPVMLFYAGEDQETPLLAADKEAGKGRIVEIAPRMYASVKVVKKALPENLDPVDGTGVLMSAQGNSFSKFMFDTLFGVYWMLMKTGDIDKKKPLVTKPENVAIIEVGRHNEYSDMTEGSLSMGPPMPLRKVKGVLFSRIVCGPAGHNMLEHVKGVHKNSPVVKEDVELYRAFFQKIAQVSDDDFSINRIIVSQRFTSHRMVNTDAVFNAVSKIGGGQVAFLSQLSIKSQVDIVSGSAVFVSTHSDDMAYMLFLRPGMSVVEVMPYGIESDLYKKLAELCGIKYRTWKNTKRENAVFDKKILDTYPLTEEQKKTIIEAEKYDPSLPTGALAYWETQDTKVELEPFSEIVRELVPPKEEKKPVEQPEVEL